MLPHSLQSFHRILLATLSDQYFVDSIEMALEIIVLGEGHVAVGIVVFSGCVVDNYHIAFELLVFVA